MRFWKHIAEFSTKILWHIAYSLWAAFLVFGIPLIIYYFIKWNPVIGDSYTLGEFIVFILYYIFVFLIWKYRTTKRELKFYIEKLIDENTTEEEKNRIKEEIRRKILFEEI